MIDLVEIARRISLVISYLYLCLAGVCVWVIWVLYPHVGLNWILLLPLSGALFFPAAACYLWRARSSKIANSC